MSFVYKSREITKDEAERILSEESSKKLVGLLKAKKVSGDFPFSFEQWQSLAYAGTTATEINEKLRFVKNLPMWARQYLVDLNTAGQSQKKGFGFLRNYLDKLVDGGDVKFNEFMDLWDRFIFSSAGPEILVSNRLSVQVAKEILNQIDRLQQADINLREISDLINQNKRYATHFENRISEKRTDVEMVMVRLLKMQQLDEGRLMYKRGQYSENVSSIVDDILKKAKLVIAIFDERQILRSEQHLTHMQVNQLMGRANEIIELKHQFRIDANDETVDWTESFVQGEIKPIPEDDSYELKIFENVSDMYEEIKSKNKDSKKGLARMLATFDWPFKEKGSHANGDKYWTVKADGLELPWNLQTASAADKRRNKGLSWAEADYSINEVGSTYTIQGFDLNYAGLIIGPSVVYRDGRVTFNPAASQNKKAIMHRDGVDYGMEHLQNELNVLIKRGVHGLFIYAVDNALIEATK